MHHHLCLQMLAYLVELSPVVFVLLVAVYVTVDRYLISIISTISTISIISIISIICIFNIFIYNSCVRGTAGQLLSAHRWRPRASEQENTVTGVSNIACDIK